MAGRGKARAGGPPSMPPRRQRTRAGLAVVVVTLALLLCACGTLATCTRASWDRGPEPQELVPVAAAGDAS